MIDPGDGDTDDDDDDDDAADDDDVQANCLARGSKGWVGSDPGLLTMSSKGFNRHPCPAAPSAAIAIAAAVAVAVAVGRSRPHPGV